MAIPDPALRQLPTPSYVVDAQRLRWKLARLREVFGGPFPRLEIAISYKTASLPAMLRIAHEAGALSEVVSQSEYELASRIGASGPRCVVNGPGKPLALLERCILDGAQLNLDSMRELELSAEVGLKLGRAVDIGLRIALTKPEATAGRRLSRFGFERGDELTRAADYLAANPQLRLRGLHAHVASRGRTLDSYRALARQLSLAFEDLGAPRLDRVDLGGGFPWPHPEMAQPTFPPLEEYAQALASELDPRLYDQASVVIEPGIALFNDCLVCVTSVVDIKQRTEGALAVLDASVHLIKPTLHGLSLPTRLLDRGSAGCDSISYDLTGYTCLEFDVIAENIELPALRPGDRLAIENVGAYTFVFKPQFIQPRPPFFVWDSGTMTMARRAERPEEMYFDD